MFHSRTHPHTRSCQSPLFISVKSKASSELTWPSLNFCRRLVVSLTAISTHSPLTQQERTDEGRCNVKKANQDEDRTVTERIAPTECSAVKWTSFRFCPSPLCFSSHVSKNRLVSPSMNHLPFSTVFPKLVWPSLSVPLFTRPFVMSSAWIDGSCPFAAWPFNFQPSETAAVIRNGWSALKAKRVGGHLFDCRWSTPRRLPQTVIRSERFSITSALRLPLRFTFSLKNVPAQSFRWLNSLGNRLILISAPQLLASAAGSIDTLWRRFHRFLFAKKCRLFCSVRRGFSRIKRGNGCNQQSEKRSTDESVNETTFPAWRCLWWYRHFKETLWFARMKYVTENGVA